MAGADAPFRPLAYPGEGKDAASAGRLKAYSDERRAISAFRTALFDSIPAGVLAAAPGYDYGALSHRAIEIPLLLEHLREVFGAPTLERYQATLAALEEPQGTRTFEELVGDHGRHHATAEACGQPLPHLQKIQSFLASLAPATREVAQRAYCRYAEAEANVGAHRFGPLVTKLRVALRAAADTEVGSRVEGPSPNALTAKVQPTTHQSPELILTALKDLTMRVDRLTTQRQREGTSPSPAPATSRERVKKAGRYCWTHGVGAHVSQECRTPGKGHQVGATLHDRRGGSNRGGR